MVLALTVYTLKTANDNILGRGCFRGDGTHILTGILFFNFEIFLFLLIKFNIMLFRLFQF